ncbi:MAG: HEPN domain-containing protein [Thermoprotei archaeon]
MAEKFWFERAREFLRVAEEVKATYPWLSCFSSQQGVEFVLKGLLVKYRGSHPVHSRPNRADAGVKRRAESRGAIGSPQGV